MKYLITGGAGFIGSHLTDALLSRGDEVCIFDDLSTGSLRNLNQQSGNKNLTVTNGSILDFNGVLEAMEGIDGCFHMAAAVGVEKILNNPIGSIKTNIHGTENVLDAAVKFNVPLLLASTSEVYGKNSIGLLNEESDRVLGSPLLFRWTYSEAKALDEAYARALHEKSGLKVKIIRYFNTVGPRQSAAYGMVIPKFFEAAMKGLPLVIHGDGSQRRIFCHVKDAVKGTLALWDSSFGDGEAFNLGGFEEIRIIDLAKRILKMTNSKSELQFIPYEILRSRGFEDMARRLPDISKIKAVTGWRPQANIDDVLTDYLESIRAAWS
jgi:UDP-glucose 4-epimerase